MHFFENGPMTTISVQLPDDVRFFAESYAKQRGFGSVEDLISSFLAEVKAQQSAIEADLLDGLDSGPPELKSAEDWHQLRLRVARKAKG
jgi:hypothetical protein